MVNKFIDSIIIIRQLKTPSFFILSRTYQHLAILKEKNNCFKFYLLH